MSRRRVGWALAVAAVTLAGCGTDAVTVAPSTTSTLTADTSAPAEPATSAAPTPTTTAPATTATTPTPPTSPVSSTTPVTPTTVTFEVEGDPMIEFSVTVGDGIDLTREELTAFVVDTLADERSWVGRGVGFRLVDDGGLFTLIVAEPARVDELCAPLRTNGRFSCARNGWVAINSLRWFGATDGWPADLDTYRRYLVNHEVGHYILGPAHDTCPGPGEPAPIMMQQTKGLDGCLANGWVDPVARAAG